MLVWSRCGPPQILARLEEQRLCQRCRQLLPHLSTHRQQVEAVPQCPLCHRKKNHLFQVAIEPPLLLSPSHDACTLKSTGWFRAVKSFRAPWICRREVGHERRQQHGTQVSTRLKTDTRLKKNVSSASFPVTPLSDPRAPLVTRRGELVRGVPPLLRSAQRPRLMTCEFSAL